MYMSSILLLLSWPVIILLSWFAVKMALNLYEKKQVNKEAPENRV
jgi:hypothetical protein